MLLPPHPLWILWTILSFWSPLRGLKNHPIFTTFSPYKKDRFAEGLEHKVSGAKENGHDSPFEPQKAHLTIEDAARISHPSVGLMTLAEGLEHNVPRLKQ
jgi:hypothetical protein